MIENKYLIKKPKAEGTGVRLRERKRAFKFRLFTNAHPGPERYAGGLSIGEARSLLGTWDVVLLGVIKAGKNGNLSFFLVTRFSPEGAGFF